MSLMVVGIFSLLFHIGAMAVEGVLVGASAKRLLPQREGRLRRVGPYALFAMCVQLPSWIGDENPLILLPFFIGAFLACYKGPLSARLVMGCMFYLLLVPVNMMLDTVERWNSWDAGSVSTMLAKVAFAVLLFFLVRRLTREGGTLDLSGRLWWLCGLLSLAPMFATLSFSIWNGLFHHNIDAAQLRLAYTTLPFVVLSAVALLIAATVLSQHEKWQRAAQLSDMRTLYYGSLQKQETQVRTLRHDLRNHLTVAQGLLQCGDVERAKAYLAELSDSPALHGVRRICQNDTANVVLSCKLEQMEDMGVAADFLITLPPKLPVADADLCALLGNALDNAMEAAARSADQTVVLRMRADRGMLMLRVENAFAQEPVKQNGVFRTAKSDAASHGFGIQGMQAIAEQYHGTLHTQIRDDRFELLVCFPLCQESGSPA
ncbi:MAG: GHKL domain-containing protein [Clostridia bacterium]|nr:GHKL domain-containing protein [Clostridia bacterium]